MGLIVNFFTSQQVGDFPGALLRALNSLLANGVERSAEAIGIYFLVTYFVIVAAGAPLLLYYCFVRFREFHAATAATENAKPRYIRSDVNEAI